MRILSFVLCSFFCSMTYAQIEPINNLYFNQWYDYPNTYFEMIWDVEVYSEDTLLGFNIYRNDELYRFQTESFLHHEAYGDSNCSEDFLSIDCCDELWIHVTAVYNSDSTESEYNDSIFCEGLMTFNEKLNNQSLNCYPNPTTDYLIVEGVNETNILIFDISGVLQIVSKSEIIDVRKLKSGYYFVIFESNSKKTFVKRIEIIN